MGGSEGGTIECGAQIPVMGRSEDIECLRIENRQHVCIGLGDDVFRTADLVSCVGGRWGESRHVGRQSHRHVLFFCAKWGYAGHAFEEGGELLEECFAGIVGIEGEG